MSGDRSDAESSRLFSAGWRTRAGLAAYPEASSHLRQGLALLATLPGTPACAQRELARQLPLLNVLIAIKSYGAPEVGAALQQALTLSRSLGAEGKPFCYIYIGMSLWLLSYTDQAERPIQGTVKARRV